MTGATWQKVHLVIRGITVTKLKDLTKRVKEEEDEETRGCNVEPRKIRGGK